MVLKRIISFYNGNRKLQRIVTKNTEQIKNSFKKGQKNDNIGQKKGMKEKK